jgi:hypothetical protein
MVENGEWKYIDKILDNRDQFSYQEFHVGMMLVVDVVDRRFSEQVKSLEYRSFVLYRSK